MSLFPDSILRKYQNDSLTPPEDILRIFKISSAELDTPEGLLKYSEGFMLLSNHLNPSSSSSIISEKFTVYKDIQERFNLFYQKTSSDPSTIEQFLKVEQSIHLINNEHTLQDASVYLKMLCESCADGSKLCQLILLLSKKHTLWSDGERSVTHHHWMNFMLPFFRFLKKFGLDDISSKFLSSEELAHSLETYLREALPTLDVDLEQQLREEINQQGIKLKRKKSDYHKLGSLSLLYYIKRFISEKDLTLFKISIIAQCYLDEIKSSSSDVQSKTLLTMYELDKILIRDSSIVNMITSIVSALMKAEGSQRTSLFSLLDYAFFKLHKEAQSKMSLFFQSPQPLMLSLFDVIQSHKQELQSLPSPKYSLFSDYYNFFMWAFLRLVKILKYNLSAQDTNLNTLVSFYQEKILPILSKESLNIFIQGQFYQGFRDSFYSSLPTTFTNLKDTFLIFNINLDDILLSDPNDNPCQLFLKFRMASSFIRNNSHKKELIDFSASQEIQNLQSDFLSLLTCPSQKQPHQILKLKYMGVFLLNLLRLNFPNDQGTFLAFTKSFLKVLIQNWSTMTAWDLNFLRETLWPLIENTDFFLEDCFYECLTVCLLNTSPKRNEKIHFFSF